ncbi:MAG: TRAP transporter substrate-binding protein [Burkholderiaceae bacterium]
MERRSFLKKTAVGAAAGAIAAPALAQSTPTLNWRLASSFPKSLDTLYGGAELFSKRVKELTNGKFNIRVFAGGEIVPGTQVLDAVQAGTIEMGHTASYYYFGKDPTLAFDAAVPFGLTSRQQTAWMLYGNGMKLTRELFDEYNIVNFIGGNSGTQMGGWFRKEIKTVADLNGLKFRVGGFAGRVLSKLGVVPQQIAGGDIYPALEKGTIDAAEWIGPYDDEKLGFNKVAKFYYYPGWWEGSTQFSFYIGKKEWEKLPKTYQAAIQTASMEVHVDIQAKYDAKNPAALARLLQSGVKLKPFSPAIMDACFKATQQTFTEESAKNPKFKKVYDDWKVFRNNEGQWFNVAEGSFDRFNATRALK